MENTKEDRRIRRTKKLLKQALAQLMDEKEFKDITVKDITEMADLNRGTFYLHYTDTYDILNKVENEILENIQSMINESIKNDENEGLSDTKFTATLKLIAEYMKENADICRCLINNKASADFIEKFRSLIFNNCSDIIKKQYSIKPNEQNDYYFSFITYGMIGLIKKWLETIPMADADDVVALTEKVINMSVLAII